MQEIDVDEIKKILDLNTELRDDFKDQLVSDDLMAIQIKHYLNFKESDEYNENYKKDVLTSINQKLNQLLPVTRENVQEVIRLYQKENPDQGTLAHWTNLQNLNNFAKMDPSTASEKWNLLFNEELSVVERINSFIELSEELKVEFKTEFDTNFSVGLDAIAYLLAGFNNKEYPLYKFSIYKKFADLYGIHRESDYGLIYQDYQEITKAIAEILNQMSLVENASVVDGQDFIYSITSYSSLKSESLVAYLHRISSKLSELKDDQTFIQYINSLDQGFLNQIAEQYKNTEKIKGIREDLANYVALGQELTISKLEEIKKTEAGKHEKKILHSWSNFTILFPFYYEKIKDRVSIILDEMIQILKEIDERFKQFKSHKVGFEGAQNFGNQSAWVVVYPEKYENHQNAKQLLFGIIEQEDGEAEIQYGVDKGSNLDVTIEKDVEIVDRANFDYNKMVVKLKESYDKSIVNDTNMTLEEKRVKLIISSLNRLDGKGKLKDIFAIVKEDEKFGLDNFADDSNAKATIRAIIQSHSSDTTIYDKKNKDYFYSVEGIGQGVWGLREEYRDNEKTHKISPTKVDSAYFVGSMINGIDYTDKFIERGIWEIDPNNKVVNEIKEVQVGDYIAIKAAYTRKNDLSFDVNEKYVSTMGIKAIGKVINNPKNGYRLEVKWEKVEPLKEWYFFTMREAFWKVERSQNDWMYGALLDFTFNDEEQDISRFLKHPYWKKKYKIKPDRNKEINFNTEINLASLYFEDSTSLKTQILLALKTGKSIILIGPPGTGKTKLAQAIVESYKVDSKMVTAMSDWSSYDTIGGYKPTNQGGLYFEDGIF